MKPSMKHGIFLAVLAAGLYALSSPFSKLLLPFMPSTLMAGFLYLGAGLGIYYYVYAQRLLGAARTSAYYAVAPFIGAFLSLIIFREVPGVLFLAALALMAVGAWLSSGD